jgi:hypothetical protein
MKEASKTESLPDWRARLRREMQPPDLQELVHLEA